MGSRSVISLKIICFHKLILVVQYFGSHLTEAMLCYAAWLDLFVLFVFVALRPMSTAMVIAGRSVHLTTLFPGQA